jgi:transaldolase/glucose-6-phosphate isomerase
MRKWWEALSPSLRRAVSETLARWERDRVIERIWAGDASVWTGDREDQWLGWLHIVHQERARVPMFAALAESVRRAGCRHVLVIGMGGSSLAPEVFARVFGPTAGAPELRVLDSIDPADVRACEEWLDPLHALVVVSSKSGTTLESNLLLEYFLDRLKRVLGPERTGGHFLAITDPGSPLSEVAVREGFRHCFYGIESIGGRYSALSVFGLVPAALLGMDIGRLLERTELMMRQCRPEVPITQNAAAVLGAILGESAREGRDKVTVLASRELRSLGAWLEQLLAESTGKRGTGIVPVEGEEVGSPEVYGSDRLFVHFRWESDPDSEERVGRLREAGHPVLSISLSDRYELGAVFFLWEMATAVVGTILGVNPFDQPDVEASKARTRALARVYEETGALARPDPIFCEGGIRLFADDRNRRELQEHTREHSLVGYLRAHFDRLREGDYFALLAYMGRSRIHEERLHGIRHRVRDARRVATSLGFGPRYLHSTGQLHKGGPNTGVFLHLIGSDAEDREIPGRPYTFGLIKRAQAYGDFAVLAERGRRQLGVEIEGEMSEGLARLDAAVERALAE